MKLSTTLLVGLVCMVSFAQCDDEPLAKMFENDNGVYSPIEGLVKDDDELDTRIFFSKEREYLYSVAKDWMQKWGMHAGLLNKDEDRGISYSYSYSKSSSSSSSSGSDSHSHGAHHGGSGSYGKDSKPDYSKESKQSYSKEKSYSKESKPSYSKESKPSYSKQSESSGSESRERKECYMRLSKLDSRFRKCEVDTQKLAEDLTSAAKRLDKLSKTLDHCMEKKNCNIEQIVSAFTSAAAQAWECIGNEVEYKLPFFSGSSESGSGSGSGSYAQSSGAGSY